MNDQYEYEKGMAVEHAKSVLAALLNVHGFTACDEALNQLGYKLDTYKSSCKFEGTPHELAVELNRCITERTKH